jgi:hypothetical protein
MRPVFVSNVAHEYCSHHLHLCRRMGIIRAPAPLQRTFTNWQIVAAAIWIGAHRDSNATIDQTATIGTQDRRIHGIGATHFI